MDNEDEELETPEPVNIGDLIVLKATQGYDGYLCANQAEMHVAMQVSPKLQNARDSLDFEYHTFRICPSLNYRHHRELQSRSKIAVKSGHREAAEALALLQQRVDLETEHNAKVLKSLAEAGTVSHGHSGNAKQSVRYGDMIMLQHVKSGYFLSAFESAAAYDGECRSVKLVEKDSPQALLKFLPRFKAHSEGSIVHYNHTLTMECIKQKGMFIHVSHAAMYDVSDPFNPALAKCLQTYPNFEVNASPRYTAFEIQKYGRYTTEDVGCVRTGDPFRLYHSQTESFMHASCDEDKDRRNPQGRVGGYPTHIPYLKKLPDLGESPDATDPSFHSSKGVWCFEPRNRRSSSVVCWDTVYRVRHVPSGRYLAVDTTDPIHEETEGLHESWYGCCLVDDAALPGEEVAVFDDAGNALGFKAVPSDWLEFVALSAELRVEEKVENTELNLRIAHIINTISDEDGKEHKKVIYLHCTEHRKPPKNSYDELDMLVHQSAKLTDHDESNQVGDEEGNGAIKDNNEMIDSASPTATGGREGRKKNNWFTAKKSKRIIASSLNLVFSSVQSAQDIFRFIPITKEETAITYHLLSFKRAFASYTHVLSDENFVISRDRVVDMIKLLLRLIGMSIKGQVHFEESEDWITKANTMLPAIFGSLFGGDSDLLVQRISCAVKLMDFVFMMGYAPYTRYREYPNENDRKLYVHINPWTSGAYGRTEEIMQAPKAVQKFVHVVLQRLCNGNIENQNYFGKSILTPIVILRKRHKANTLANMKQEALLLKQQQVELKTQIGEDPHGDLVDDSNTIVEVQKRKSWMSILLHHLEDPLGAAVTLSKLLGENEFLLKKYASKELVSRFLDLIRNLGPQPRLVNFFEAICTVDDKPIKTNQEMVLRLTWIDKKWRRKVYLETKQFTHDVVKPSKIKKYKPVLEPSGKLSGGWQPEHTQAFYIPSSVDEVLGGGKYPPLYIGKDEFEKKHSFYPVYVRWDAMDAWSPEKDALFHSPAYFHIRSHDINGDSWIRLEELCWILEPERLCFAITGKTWDFMKENDDDNRLSEQQQLAQYYAGQLSMISRLCYGRSYNCIAWMERSFPYTMLCAISYCVHLPAKVRSASTELLRSLYLNRYPQLSNLGRSSFPEQLWVYQLAKPDHELSLEINAIKHQKIHDENAFPSFCLLPTHKYAMNPDPFLGFPGPTKFFLLRHLGDEYLKSFGTGVIVYTLRQENEFMHSVVNLVASLTNFGFQSSHEKIKDLMHALIRVLDGRMDVEDVRSGKADKRKGQKNKQIISTPQSSASTTTAPPITSDESERLSQVDQNHQGGVVSALGEYLPFQPLEKRYEMSPSASEVTLLKGKIIDVILDVMNLIANFRLGRLLETFKDYRENVKMVDELRTFHEMCENQEEQQYEGSLVKKLFDDFEDLFEDENHKLLSIDELSGGQEIDIILIDCLMYEDDKLFAKALELLDRTYGQRRRLLNSLKEVVMLKNEIVPIFGNSADLSADISFLTYLVRSSEVWGVCSHTSGPFGHDKYKQIKTLCAKLDAFFGGKTEYTSPTSPANEEIALDSSSESPDFDSISFRQDVMRCLNLHNTLIDSLEIDYNSSFKGSVCTHEEKIKSREILISAQRRLIDILVKFVRGNTKNQNVVFKHLKELRKHFGPLSLPPVWPEGFNDKHKALIYVDPGMNTEAVVVECLRNNASLCQDEVPRDLLEEFGILVDISPDPTSCINLEFLSIVCLPHGYGTKPIARNQEMVLEVLLSDQLKSISKLIPELFLLPHSGALYFESIALPYRFVDLLSTCILHENVQNASKLQGQGISIEVTMEVLKEIFSNADFGEVFKNNNHDNDLGKVTLDTHDILRGRSLGRDSSLGRSSSSSPSKRPSIPPPAQSKRSKGGKLVSPKFHKKSNSFSKPHHNYISNMIRNNEFRNIGMLFHSMLEFLYLQMEVLVVDPKIFRTSKAWQLVTIGVKNVFNVTKQAIFEHKLTTLLCNTTMRALKIATLFIHGSRALDHSTFESKHESVLLTADDSLYNSAYVIATTLSYPNANMIDDQKDFFQSVEFLDRDSNHGRDSIGSSRHSDRDSSSNNTHGLNVALFTPKDPLSYPLSKVDFKQLQASCIKFCNVLDPSQNLPHIDGEESMEEKEGEEKEEGEEEEEIVVLDKSGKIKKGTQKKKKDKNKNGIYDSEEKEEHLEEEEILIDEHDKKSGKKKGLFNRTKKEEKERKATESPSIILGYFCEALEFNKHFKTKLNARQFSLVEVLENIENSTGAAGIEAKVDGADGEGSISITWKMVVERMVKYVTDHNHDVDSEACLRVMRLLRAFLVQARSDMDGNAIGIWDLSDSLRKAYVEKQSSFVDLGVVRIALKALATHSANVEGNLADEAVEILLEMTFGGNTYVQGEIVRFIHEQDRDNKLVNHLEARISGALVLVMERKESTEEGFEHISDDHLTAYQDLTQTFNFLQQLCEGHNLECQNVLREQPGHMVSVNLISSAAHVVYLLCDSSAALTMLSEVELFLLNATFDFLLESTLGPCEGNQIILAENDDLLASIDKVLQSHFHKRIRLEHQLKCKNTAIQLLVALLEGRSYDLFVHEILASEFQPPILKYIRDSVMRNVKEHEELKEKKRHQRKLLAAEKDEESAADLKRAILNISDDDAIHEVSLNIMSGVSTLMLELSLVEEYGKSVHEMFSDRKEIDLLDDHVRVVEIKWGDRLERSSFPVPEDAYLLTDKTKEDFMKSADLSTNEKRMKEMLAKAPIFIAEIEQIDRLRKSSLLYSWISHNIVSIKWSMYALVVLLNLNIVMASYGEGSPDGYVSIVDGMSGNIRNKYISSLLISIVLACMNLFGYVVIVIFLAMTEVPITVTSTDDYVKECVENMSMKESEYRNPGAFTWWFVTLIFNVVFIIQHIANYPENINFGLYAFLVFGINLPWTLSCIRNYIVVPNTRQTRIFCVVFDVLVTKPFFRNHVVLMVCSINGFYASYYFPLMLMDIVNNSKVISNIAQNVQDNLVALGWVFYLIIVTIVIYAQFGLEYFEGHWNYFDDDASFTSCHSVVSCAWLIFYKGIPSQSLGDIMTTVTNRDAPDYLERVVFELSFFVWIGVLLFNIITGLMVDGFGALRDQDNERKDILENSCFVCGFTRDSYEELPNFRGPNFDHHIDEEHYYWNYLYFYIYLKRKDKTEYSGVETYAWHKMSKGDPSWLPVRNTLALQESNIVVEDNDAAAVKRTKLVNTIVKKVVSEVKETVQDYGMRNSSSDYQGVGIGMRASSSGVRSSSGLSVTEAQVSIAMFLAWIDLEKMSYRLSVGGFTDLESLEPFKQMEDREIADEYRLTLEEARRFKAFLEIKTYDFPSLCAGFSVGHRARARLAYEGMGTALSPEKFKKSHKGNNHADDNDSDENSNNVGVSKKVSFLNQKGKAKSFAILEDSKSKSKKKQDNASLRRSSSISSDFTTDTKDDKHNKIHRPLKTRFKKKHSSGSIDEEFGGEDSLVGDIITFPSPKARDSRNKSNHLDDLVSDDDDINGINNGDNDNDDDNAALVFGLDKNRNKQKEKGIFKKTPDAQEMNMKDLNMEIGSPSEKELEEFDEEAVFGLKKSKGENVALPGSGGNDVTKPDDTDIDQLNDEVDIDDMIYDPTEKEDEDKHDSLEEASKHQNEKNEFKKDEEEEDLEDDFISSDLKPPPPPPVTMKTNPLSHSSRFSVPDDEEDLDKEDSDEEATSSLLTPVKSKASHDHDSNKSPQHPTRPSTSPPRGRAGGKGGRGRGSGKPRDYSGPSGGHHVVKPPPSQHRAISATGTRGSSRSPAPSRPSARSPSHHATVASTTTPKKANKTADKIKTKSSKGKAATAVSEPVYVEDIRAEPVELDDDIEFDDAGSGSDEDPAAMLLSMKAQSINDYHEDI